jgi:hypothetical protein
LINKTFLLKNDKRKSNNNHKKRTKVNIKNQILRDEIKKRFKKKKYIEIKNLRTKFNLINK